MNKKFGAILMALLVGVALLSALMLKNDLREVIDDVEIQVIFKQKQMLNAIIDNMVKVEGGTFTMGATSEQGSDAYDYEYPIHQVTLGDYYISKYEVTQSVWKDLMGYTPAPNGDQWCSYYGIGADYPAYYISWNDAQNFIAKLNALTDKTFRLPTEAEWEYAARGGNKNQGYKYSGSDTIADVAWYYDNAGSIDRGLLDYGTHLVGTKIPNELGIYDMSGNVYEWCSDRYSAYYTNGAQTNPVGPTVGSGRVLRGGCWNNNLRCCRVSCRDFFSPNTRINLIGFRLVLVQN